MTGPRINLRDVARDVGKFARRCKIRAMKYSLFKRGCKPRARLMRARTGVVATHVLIFVNIYIRIREICVPSDHARALRLLRDECFVAGVCRRVTKHLVLLALATIKAAPRAVTFDFAKVQVSVPQDASTFAFLRVSLPFRQRSFDFMSRQRVRR